MVLERDYVLGLKKGEVIEYMGEHGKEYLHIDEVNEERGRVSGHITSALGVNSHTIDFLIENGIRIAKWNEEE